MSDINPLDSPVFVVGPLRSGTTMLRLLLGHHSKINGFGEFEEAVSQGTEAGWPAIGRYHQFLALDRAVQIRGFTVDSSLGYVELVKDFLHQAWLRNQAPIISASVHSNFHLLPKIWPQARFIHLLRDPRDVARSCIGMGWVGNVYEGTRYWIEPEQRWGRLCELVPSSQLLSVRYEDLVAAPERVLGEICNFLGIEYEAQMLALEADTTYSRPDASYAEQWRRKLTPREIRWVEIQCAGLMRARGYEPASDLRPLSILERLWILVQNRTYRWRFNIQRWGLSLWLQHHLAKRLGLKKWYAAVQLQINDIARQHLK